MKTIHLKTGVKPSPEMSSISDTFQTMGNVHYNKLIINQPLSQTFRESH